MAFLFRNDIRRIMEYSKAFLKVKKEIKKETDFNKGFYSGFWQGFIHCLREYNKITIEEFEELDKLVKK